jgi:hypothetical protein
LKRKYNTSSFGAEFIGFFAIDTTTNLPAGYYGVFPIYCELNGQRILAAQSGDTMTNPNHQGKGLFTMLAKMTYELAQKEGINFVFGFPNKNSYPGFIKKLAWNHYGDINNYIIKTGSFPFDKLAKKFLPFRWVYGKYIDFKINSVKLNAFFKNSIAGQNPELGFVIHDQTFYDYKTYFKSYCIKIGNTRCFLKIDGSMWIGDIEFCSKGEFIKAVEGLICLAKKAGCSSIQFSVYKDTFYDKILKKRYEVKNKMPVGFVSFNKDISPEKMAYQAIDFDTY